MAKIALMKLIELIVLKQDIDNVIKYIGTSKKFQFYFNKEKNKDISNLNKEKEYYNSLNMICSYLEIPLQNESLKEIALVTEEDLQKADKFISDFDEFKKHLDEISGSDLENQGKIQEEKKNYIDKNKDEIYLLLNKLLVSSKISDVKEKLESTELTYKITGWISKDDYTDFLKDLDKITENRIAEKVYDPREIPEVLSGKEKVPVQFKHKKFLKSFERMVFSFGSPLYGTIDPTPFVAIFFTLLFGIMFGDLGQGLVFVLLGILMSKKILKVGGWNKFAPIFITIGITSSVMGLLTGEFFSNESLLEPFAHWVTGLFGEPHAPILKIMPSSDPDSIKTMFGLFGVAIAIGFIIISIGLIINIINNLKLKRYDQVLFGKNGLAGTIFFWYTIALILRIVLLKHSIAIYDWIVLGLTLFFAAFAEPFERLMTGERPVFENGFGIFIISGIVEIIEVLSGFLSNTISFVRVGAFALSHAVLDYMIFTLTNMCSKENIIARLLILIVGNAIIVALEGMIVAIQTVRLQYYEFFSRFFTQTGKEFEPFRFDNN